MKKIFILFLVLILNSCGGYRINMPGPGLGARFAEIFPPKIGDDLAMSFLVEDLGGIETYYGPSVENFNYYIYALSSTDIPQIQDIFLQEIFPEFQKLSSYSLMEEGKEYLLLGKKDNGEEWVSWTNQFFLFVIKAGNKELLNELIDSFPYISR